MLWTPLNCQRIYLWMKTKRSTASVDAGRSQRSSRPSGMAAVSPALLPPRPQGVPAARPVGRAGGAHRARAPPAVVGDRRTPGRSGRRTDGPTGRSERRESSPYPVALRQRRPRPGAERATGVPPGRHDVQLSLRTAL